MFSRTPSTAWPLSSVLRRVRPTADQDQTQAGRLGGIHDLSESRLDHDASKRERCSEALYENRNIVPLSRQLGSKSNSTSDESPTNQAAHERLPQEIPQTTSLLRHGLDLRPIEAAESTSGMCRASPAEMKEEASATMPAPYRPMIHPESLSQRGSYGLARHFPARRIQD